MSAARKASDDGFIPGHPDWWERLRFYKSQQPANQPKKSS